jgi:hypothetical protein
VREERERERAWRGREKRKKEEKEEKKRGREELTVPLKPPITPSTISSSEEKTSCWPARIENSLSNVNAFRSYVSISISTVPLSLSNSMPDWPGVRTPEAVVASASPSFSGRKRQTTLMVLLLLMTSSVPPIPIDALLAERG